MSWIGVVVLIVVVVFIIFLVTTTVLGFVWIFECMILPGLDDILLDIRKARRERKGRKSNERIQ